MPAAALRSLLASNVITDVLTTGWARVIFERMESKSQHLQIRVTRRQKARLKRLAGAAGQDVSSYVLARVLPPAAGRVEALVTLLAGGAEERYTLAELNDRLAALGPGEVREAVANIDVRGLSPFLQNYVAAMIEQLSHMHGVAPPGWVTGVPALEEPWFATRLRSLRLHLMRASPIPFKRRNIFVDAAIGARV